ncbi:MAG: glycosyltransferase family 39 protein [Nitrososphaerota archaeon]
MHISSFYSKEIRPHLASLCLITLLSLSIYVGSAFTPSLQDDADAAHAQAAKEIAETGDWITLHINGIRYLEKAPLMYWMVAISYKVFGYTEFATRLPLALASLFLALVVFYFGRWIGGERAGLYSALGVVTGLGFYLFTRILIPEVILTLWITCAMFAFLKAYHEESSARLYYVFYFFMALAVLTKGLIGIVFPSGILFAYVFYTGGLHKIPTMRIFTGSLLFLLISAPWHIAAGLANRGGPQGRGFFWFYFVNEHFLRYLGKRYPVDYDTVPIEQFWGLHLVWVFPFTTFLPFAFSRLRKALLSRRLDDQKQVFLWLWALVIVGFFSFSTRQEYYTYPAFPAIALMCGVALADREQARDSRLIYGQGFLAGAGLLIGLLLLFLVWQSWHLPATDDISKVLTSNPENYRLALGHMSDLTTEAFAVLRTPAIGAAVCMLGFVPAFWLRLKRLHLQSTLLMTLTVAGFLFFAHNALGYFDPYLSSKGLAKEIEKRYEPGSLVVIHGEYQGGSSIGFYLKDRVLLLNGRMTGLEFGSYYPDAPKVFIDNEQIRTLWKSERRIFLFTYDDKFHLIEKYLEGGVYRIAAAGEKSIYSNRE